MNRSEEERQEYAEELKGWARVYKYGSFTGIRDPSGRAELPIPYFIAKGGDWVEYVVQLILFRRYRGDPAAATRPIYDESRSILAFDPHAFDEKHK